MSGDELLVPIPQDDRLDIPAFLRRNPEANIPLGEINAETPPPCNVRLPEEPAFKPIGDGAVSSNDPCSTALPTVQEEQKFGNMTREQVEANLMAMVKKRDALNVAIAAHKKFLIREINKL